MKRRLLTALSMIGVAAAAVLLAGCGGTAATSSSETGDGAGGGSGGTSAMFQSALDALVDEGTITAEQEDAVLEALTANGPRGQTGTPPSGQPMPQGSPPAQPDGQTNPPDSGQMFSGALDGLVEDGTITSAQQAAVLDALSAAMPQPGSGPGAPSAAPTAAGESS